MIARIEAYAIAVLLALVALTWWGCKAYYYYDGYKDGLVAGAEPYKAESAKAVQQHDDTQKLLDSAAADREAMDRAAAVLRTASNAAIARAKEPIKVTKVFPTGCVVSKDVVESSNAQRR